MLVGRLVPGRSSLQLSISQKVSHPGLHVSFHHFFVLCFLSIFPSQQLTGIISLIFKRWHYRCKFFCWFEFELDGTASAAALCWTVQPNRPRKWWRGRKRRRWNISAIHKSFALGKMLTVFFLILLLSLLFLQFPSCLLVLYTSLGSGLYRSVECCNE